jgi:hypothetical protein
VGGALARPRTKRPLRRALARPRIVTGIKPTGIPHLGNHLGMIRPALDLATRHDGHLFIADYHALNTGPDPTSCTGGPWSARARRGPAVPLLAPVEEVQRLRDRYLAGGLGYGHAKQLLLEVLIETFADARARFADIIAAPEEISRILDDGGRRTRELATTTLERVRDAIGIRRVTTVVAGGG